MKRWLLSGIVLALVLLMLVTSGCLPKVTYSVSGYVKDEAGNGIAGVTIYFSGGYEAVTTDSEGHWSKEGLSGSVTVTPSKEGYTFTPPSITATGPRDDVDFVGAYTGTPSVDYLAVAAGDGILIIDVSDPEAPKKVGESDTDGVALGVCVSGDYAYVADGGDGLAVVDVSDPADPALVADMFWPSPVAVFGL